MFLVLKLFKCFLSSHERALKKRQHRQTLTYQDLLVSCREPLGLVRRLQRNTESTSQHGLKQCFFVWILPAEINIKVRISFNILMIDHVLEWFGLRSLPDQ